MNQSDVTPVSAATITDSTIPKLDDSRIAAICAAHGWTLDAIPSLRELARAFFAEGADAYRAAQSEALEPVSNDLLPAIGTTVQIHLNSQNAWVNHVVTGYYVQGALQHQIKEGEKHAHRVFVRVMDAQGYPNARLLSDVRPAA